jgi:hypothetical protein
MKRLTAVISSVVVLAGAVGVGSPLAWADTSWDFATGPFTLTDGHSGTATATLQNVRVTGSAASGSVGLSNGRYSCSTHTFSGLTAVFTLDGQYNPCHGSITFSLDAAGLLTVSDSSVYIPSTIMTGPSKDSIQGTKYPPEIVCTATPMGPSDVTVAWTDSGSGATQYDITALPSLAQPVTISSGSTQVALTGLQPGTDYSVTVTAVGFTVPASGAWTGSTTCSARTDVLTGPVGTVGYGVITGKSSQDAEREYTLSAGSPPPGWALEWMTRFGAITPHGSQKCGTTSAVTPQWTRSGQTPIPGAAVTIAPKCTVPTPVLDPYPGSHINGNTVTLNYQFPSAFEPGTIVWAMYKLSGSSTEMGPISLGNPPAGGQSGTASIPAAGLKAPIGVRIQVYATNGPITSAKSAWQDIPGETVAGPASPTNQPTAPSTVPTDGANGASTGTAGGSSGSAGAGGGSNPCLAPNGTLYVDFAGSVGSTLTMAPNTFGLPVPKSFSVTKGALPAGVRLDGTFGVISGTPERSNGGIGAIEITTTWPDGTARSSDFNIAIDDPHHAVNYPNRVIGSVGRQLAIRPLPVNSQGAEKFELVCGTLPAGVSLDPRTGVMSGAPTALDERPVPLRVRMTDRYGWVDASLLFVVNDGVTPWLAYPEYMQIGVGRKVSIVPTRTGLPAVKRYWLSQGLPTGLRFSTKTGAITGTSVVNDGTVYEPTIMAIGADGKPVASTWVSITVVKPAIAMKVTARPASKSLKRGTSTLVRKVKRPLGATLTAKVTCKKCSFTFNKKTGKVVVEATKSTKKVTATIVGQPSGARGRAAYAGHTWTRTWHVARTKG